MRRVQQIGERFKTAWGKLEHGTQFAEEFVEGTMVSLAKVEEEYHLGVAETGQQPSFRKIDQETAENVLRTMIALGIEREEKSNKGERQ